MTKPGGRVVIYDIMRMGEPSDAELSFPVPWAADASMSFVESPERYRAAMQEAGLQPSDRVSRREMASPLRGIDRRRGWYPGLQDRR